MEIVWTELAEESFDEIITFIHIQRFTIESIIVKRLR